MALAWNEIKDRALAFSKEWAKAESDSTEAERVAYLFERYQQLTSLLPAVTAKKTRKLRS